MTKKNKQKIVLLRTLQYTIGVLVIPICLIAIPFKYIEEKVTKICLNLNNKVWRIKDNEL